MPFQLPGWWNWKATYALVLLILLSAAFFSLKPFSDGAQGVTASIVWGTVTLILSLTFMLGAAQTPMQFLVFFGTGAFGAGMGYLVGAWLTPSGESNPLDQVRNIVAGVLTGVVGTKLLTLWDDLVNPPPGGGLPRIMTAPYFVPIVLFLVGFTVSLSAFYTVRTGQSGDVRVTYSPRSDVLDLGGKHIGVLTDTVVNFAGAANSPADVTVSWDFHLEQPCGPPVPGAKPYDKATFQKEMVDSFEIASGRLKTPTLQTLQDWINTCPGSQNWFLTATSNQDRSKFYRYNLKFCRTQQDCPVVSASTTTTPPAGTTGTGGTGGVTGAPSPTGSKASPAPAAPADKQEGKKSDNAKSDK